MGEIPAAHCWANRSSAPPEFLLHSGFPLQGHTQLLRNACKGMGSDSGLIWGLGGKLLKIPLGERLNFLWQLGILPGTSPGINKSSLG